MTNLKSKTNVTTKPFLNLLKPSPTVNYISVEGLEGAGKTTAMPAILSFFEGRTVVSVREPGGTPLAEKLRDIVKQENEYETVDTYTETLCFFAARNQLLTNVVIPSIERGDFVISDRCYLSSVAYQQKEHKLVKALTDNLVVKPDLIIYLDIDPVVGLQRAKKRGVLDRIEKNDILFFEKAREVYLKEASENKSIIVINADQEPEKVQSDITAALTKYLK